MITVNSIVIFKHTTSSTPQAHIVYIIEVTNDDGVVCEVQRRFSEFSELKALLGDSFPLPAKHAFSTTIVPRAWVENALIEERKRGLQIYLTSLLHDGSLHGHPAFTKFLTPGPMPLRDVDGMKEGKGLKLIAASYYPSWAADNLPPSKIDFSKFDVLFFAFVTPNGVAGISWDAGSEETLKKLVSSARQSGHGTRIVLSVGGWSGSHWFSQAMSNAPNRAKLTATLAVVVNKYSLDGVDIDWEYPNAPGEGNPYSPDDAANFLSFLKTLRTALGPSKIISAAVTQLPWLGPDGDSLKDVTEYAAEMTFVNIMNYDVFGASSKPGPNAPLGNLCGSSDQPEASAQAALKQWTKAGMPLSKLLLGLPLYGYVSKSSAETLTGSLAPSSDRLRPPHPRPQLKGIRTLAPFGDLSTLWGQQIAFSQIVGLGALKQHGDGTYGENNGYTMGWDNCSDTPYLFNTGRTTVVTYDDTYSIASKTQFAKKSGMAGCFTWSLDQDDDMALHNVMLHNLGK